MNGTIRAAFRIVVATFLVAVLLAPATADAKPARIVSLNLCIDGLLLDLAERDRIAAVTYLSFKPAYSLRAAEFEGLTAVYGLAEEVLALEPDLVLTGPFSPGNTTRILEKLGYRVVELPVANSIAEMRALIVDVAALIGEEEAGAAMLASIDRRLAALPPPPAEPLRAVLYGANGLTAGADTLAEDVLRRAGFSSMTAEAGISGWRWIDLETLLTTRPDVLVMNRADDGPPSVGRAVLSHPALARFAETRTIVTLPESQWECAGPATIATLEQLAAARLALDTASAP
ncbi:MAG: ABC transporter substrate-binding protein [Dongiaceae bacterium]